MDSAPSNNRVNLFHDILTLWLRDIFVLRQERKYLYFNGDQNLEPFVLRFIINRCPKFWSMTLIDSHQFRQFLVDVHQRSINYQNDIKMMYKFLIIDPICYMQWHTKISEIIKLQIKVI